MPVADRAASLTREVVARYGVAPAAVRVVRSPYRVCPLGAHVDHQLGPVTAMALDRCVLLAFAPSGSSSVKLVSHDFPGEVAFAVDAVPDVSPGDWGNFPRGAARALANYRPTAGIVGVVEGDLPGGGVSSSAAVGVAFLLALEHANDLAVSTEGNVRLDQAIENGYLGLRNGILDQAAILYSRRGHLTRIRCATGGHELIPPGPGMRPFTILLAFSGLRQALVGTDYNRRVGECAEAARSLLAASGRDAVPLLGNVRPEEYAAHKAELTGPPARRAEHFFTEIDRVERGVAAWRAGDLAAFGRLVTESGASSIHNYECGSPPLIALYELLAGADGVYGTRFSGAGFRGCCVALVRPDAAATLADRVNAEYARRFPELAAHAPVELCASDDAAGLLDLP